MGKDTFNYDTSLINYNELTNTNYYNYYLYGTSNSGKTTNNVGFYYPLSLVSYGNDHIHTFVEFPNIKFYMKNDVTTHNKTNYPPASLNLINYNLFNQKFYTEGLTYNTDIISSTSTALQVNTNTNTNTNNVNTNTNTNNVNTSITTSTGGY